ncbi:hypothetical protein M0R72_16360 [Candidatus Pacearchaeota archaeon]|jgi:hypothetical protein|nr:hypothetical protein [Candidatus Pacearchaeota archaeon]
MDNESWQMIKNFTLTIVLGGFFMAIILVLWALLTLDATVEQHLHHLAKIRGF